MNYRCFPRNILLAVLSILLLALLAGCQEKTPSGDGDDTTNAVTEAPIPSVTLIEGGESDYVIVCDTADANALRLANALAFTVRQKFGYSPTVHDASEGPFPHEILIGNVRDSAAPLAATLEASGDFAVALVEDDLVICASASRMLTYALAYVEHTLIAGASNAAWTVSEGDAFHYRASDMADMNYFAYEKQFHSVSLNDCFETHTITLENGSTMLYRLYIPYGYDDTRAYPVFISLHGVGGRGNDGLSPLDCLIDAFDRKNSPLHDAIVIVPQCPNDQFWVNVQWEWGTYSTDAIPETAALKGVLTILEQVEREYSTDKNRYYVAGYSMGGYGTWDLLARHPEIFAAAIPICGGADPSKAADMADIPIHAFHGDSDIIVPVSGTRAMVAALEAAGSTLVIYTEEKGLGHAGWDRILGDLNNLRWLFAQQKSASVS